MKNYWNTKKIKKILNRGIGSRTDKLLAVAAARCVACVGEGTPPDGKVLGCRLLKHITNGTLR